MDIDEDKIDEVVLALLRLTLHDERYAWKGFDWETTGRLHKKGFIGGTVPAVLYAAVKELSLSAASVPWNHRPDMRRVLRHAHAAGVTGTVCPSVGQDRSPAPSGLRR
jgi:hypothetical protein